MSADWDLSDYFADIAEAARACDALAEALRDPVVEVDELEALDVRVQNLSSYLGCRGAADSGDLEVKRASAQLASVKAQLTSALTSLRAKLKAGERPADHDDAAYYLTRLKDAPGMDDARERLYADLEVTGKGAWSRLYDTVQGSLSFELDGESYPVSMTRTLLEDPDPARRARAFKAANGAWASSKDVLAAALNGIAGERLTVDRHRGEGDHLAGALHQAGISRATLDAMLEAVRARRELPRKFLRGKAKGLGKARLDFCDLLAPTRSAQGHRLTWAEGKAQVLQSFTRYPALKAFAAHAMDSDWIDHGPRPGKRPGAFCSSSRKLRQSRIFMTFHGSSGDVRTLAHELGHAFHGLVMKPLRPWATYYPMTLAETASTFAEQMLTDAQLDGAGDDVHRAILDQRLNNAAVFLLNTPMRFEFEDAFYQRRRAGELDAGELSELMAETQRRVYGDALDEVDPLFWASKQHFFMSGVSFYNFPYTFGFLFSAGIYQRFKSEGAAFLPAYEALLMDTGRAPAEEVARKHLGADLTQPEFWNASIDLVEADLAAREALGD